MSVRDQWYVNDQCLPIDSEEEYPQVKVAETDDEDVFYLYILGEGRRNACLALSREELGRLKVNIVDCLRSPSAEKAAAVN